MAKKTSIEEVQQLIDLGKEKGYLTYDEVNSALPDDLEPAEGIRQMKTESPIQFLGDSSVDGVAFRRRRVIAGKHFQIATSRNDVGISGRFDEFGDPFGLVLAIAIERDHPVVALIHRRLESRDQGGTVATIDGMPNGGNIASTRQHVRSAIGGAVIDHENMVAMLHHFIQDFVDVPHFVEDGQSR